MKTPLVAVIGRPNVGKSSLFNRFLKKRMAVVNNESGITRDRNYALCDWAGRDFFLIDTGGMVPGTKKSMEKIVLEQSEVAVAEADLILLIVDCQTGPDGIDEKIARLLIASGKSILLLANKADNEFLENERFQFERLGLGEPLPISATTGRGVGEVLDKIVECLPATDGTETATDNIRIAVIGRPNVGKSSFINKLIGQERVIVSALPGTTRDAIDTLFEINGKKYTLIDTAGLRRKVRVTEDVEYYTTLRTLRAIENSHIAIILIDAIEGLTVQDMKIIEDAVDARRGVILAVNKWDLVEKDGKTADQYSVRIKELAKTFDYIPIIFISCLTGQRVNKTIEIIDKVHENWNRTLSTSSLNEFIEEAVNKQPPAAARGKYIKFYYVTQTESCPPTFLFFCNYPMLLQRSYLRYIENQLRLKFQFEGTPLRIKIRKK